MPEIHGAAEAKRAPKEVPVGDIPGREPASPREDWVPQPSAASAGSAGRQADGTVQTTTTSVGDLILKAREISGVEQVALEPATDGPVEIYTLNGIRTTATTLGDLTPGLYIVRQGSTAKKIYIR